MAFDGFSPDAPAFLAGLAAHNEREWFQPRKKEYEALILRPMWHLVAALAPTMQEIDPQFDATPKGGAVSRIYRDTRFSKDKSPYRVNQWISFKRPGKDWPDRPAFFMEFRPESYRYGMGFYAASPATMTALRSGIMTRQAPLREAMVGARNAGFDLAGEAYKRPRLPEGAPADLAEWFGLKSVYVVRDRAMGEGFFSAALAEELSQAFAALAPLYRILGEAAAR